MKEQIKSVYRVFIDGDKYWEDVRDLKYFLERNAGNGKFWCRHNYISFPAMIAGSQIFHSRKYLVKIICSKCGKAKMGIDADE